MANTLLTVSMITREVLRILTNRLGFTMGCNREYDDKFAVTGAKIGATVNVRRPARFVGTTGPNLSVEDYTETQVPVTLDTQFHVDTTFTTQDLTLSLDDFSRRVLQPAVATIANKIDRDGLAMAYQWTNSLVGTPGTTPATLLVYLQGMAKLDLDATPRDGLRRIVIDPNAMAATVDALKGLFQSSTEIKKQYENGMMGMAIGADWYMDQNVVSHLVGPLGGTPLVNGAAQGLTSGWAQTGTLVTDGWTAAAALRLRKGDVFTIANVFAVNPQNRQSTGQLRQFVVRADASSDGSGNLTATIAPAIISAGAFQNVTAAPADNAALTIVGTAATSYPQNMIYHRDAFTLACADLEIPQGVHFAGRMSDKQTGISVRVVRQYAISTDTIPCRIDVLYGWAPLYPEMSCRLIG